MTVQSNDEILAAKEELSALNRSAAKRLPVARELRMRELRERSSGVEQMVRVP